MSRIGIIDWGIGGVSIYKLIKKQMPGVPVTYFSDTGATPYGKMDRVELSVRLNTIIPYLKSRGVTHVVIGCNAASTAVDDLRDNGLPVFGVIQPAVKMVARIRPGNLGLIGGRRTVVSGVHRRAFAGSGVHVRQRIAQPLSGLIESGDIGSEALQAEARRIIAPLMGCSHILLACTHYPAILPVLRHEAPNVGFLDPAEELVKSLVPERLSRGPGRDEFLTTGSTAAMKRAARCAFGVKISTATRVSL